MTNEVTVEGVTYNVSDEPTYTMEPGKLYQDSCLSSIVCLDFKGFTSSYSSSFGRWDVGNVCFPLRELTPVAEKQPEWREVDTDKYWNYLNTVMNRSAASELNDLIAETLKAQRIRIHNVDGSVTEYTKNPASGWGYEYKHSWGGSQKITISPEEMQVHTQSAFMRGSKVEVLR